jgi:dienelactone hydrolase
MKASSRPARKAGIEVSPTPIMVDGSVSIRCFGLVPAQPATLRARLRDDSGLLWSSWAAFEVGAKGELALDQLPPADGTYAGVDPEGLLWSMQPESWDAAQEHGLKTGILPTSVEFEVEQSGEAVATCSTELRWLAAGVKEEELSAGGLVGVSFTPSGQGPFPPVLVVGGSDGGLRLETAALLASHGIFALALAYFRYPGLPEELVEIPLEYFGRALDWLRADPRSDPTRGLGVVGRSRGGELALVLGATFEQVDAVVAFVPSGIVHSGILGGAESWQAAVPAWTKGGVPLPFLGHEDPSGPASALPAPIALTPIYCRDLSNWAAVERAAIPLERSRARILMLSGAADAMWPSPLLSELALSRLARHGFPHPVRHIAFPDAGHRFVFPTLPGSVTSGRHPADHQVYEYGGTPKGNARACRLAHREMLDWLAGRLEASPIS